MEDPQSVLPDQCPFLIWDDPVELNTDWTPEEQDTLASMGGIYKRLLSPLPSGTWFSGTTRFLVHVNIRCRRAFASIWVSAYVVVVGFHA